MLDSNKVVVDIEPGVSIVISPAVINKEMILWLGNLN